MKIKINIKKIHMLIFFVLVVSLGIYFVIAQSYPLIHNPGHTIGEISGVCRSDGVGCHGITPFTDVVYLITRGDAYCGTDSAFLCLAGTDPNTFWTNNFIYDNPSSTYVTSNQNSIPCHKVLCLNNPFI